MRSRNAGRKELPEDDEDAGMLIQGIAVFLDPDTTLNPSAIGAKLPPEEMEEEMTVPHYTPFATVPSADDRRDSTALPDRPVRIQ